MGKVRVVWADTAKALGMLLVFLGHFIESQVYTGHDWLLVTYRHIYSFHMPFFFLLAGFFYSPRPLRYGQLFLQKIRTRLIPVLFFVGLALPFWMKPDWWGMINVVPSQELDKAWLLLQGKPVANWPCWFLVCLFSVELMASELIPFLTSRWKLLVAVAGVYAFARLLTNDVSRTASMIGFIDNWWFLQEAFMALFFYLAGHALAHYGGALLPSASRVRSAAMSVLYFGLLVAATYYLFPDQRQAVNMSASNHGDWRLFPLASLAGSLMLMHVASCIPRVALLDYVGKNTLPMIGMCGLFLSFFNPLIWSYLPLLGDPMLLLYCIGVSLCSLLVSLPAVYLFNRFLPFLVGAR